MSNTTKIVEIEGTAFLENINMKLAAAQKQIVLDLIELARASCCDEVPWLTLRVNLGRCLCDMGMVALGAAHSIGHARLPVAVHSFYLVVSETKGRTFR